MLAPAPSWAQGGHGHAHNGQEQKIGRYEVELVVRGAEATLLVIGPHRVVRGEC